MVVPAVADRSRDDKQLGSQNIEAPQASISDVLGAEPPAYDPGLATFAGLLCLYAVGLAMLATLSPFNFRWWKPHSYSFATSPRDLVLNLALLFPAGFLFRLARGERGPKHGLDALGLGLGLSLLIESVQIFLPTRVTSVVDVLANGAGAWAGAWSHARLARWFDRRLHRRLGLHLPLVHILYLLVPLCSLDALTVKSSRQGVFVLPLAGFMAWIAAGLYQHRLLPVEARAGARERNDVEARAGARERNDAPPRSFAQRYSVAIGAMFGVGYLPLCTRSPRLFVCVVVAMIALTRLAVAFQRALPEGERRFVLRTIRGALPWYLGYVLALAGRSWWHGPWVEPQVILLRDIAAFTLLGYLVSELHGRADLRDVSIVARTVLVAFAVAVAYHLLRDHSVGFQFPRRMFGLLPCAALAGAVIHRAQLRLVRRRNSLLPPAPAARVSHEGG